MSSTNGWDAVCALDLSAVNALLLQQYFADGPGGPTAPLAFTSNPNVLFTFPMAMEIVLSPPLLTFASPGSAALTANVVSAMAMWLGNFNTPGTPQGLQASWLPVSGLAVNRVAQLQSLPGTVSTVGQVALGFGGNLAFGSASSTQQAIDDFIDSGPMQYVLGTILNSNPGPGLEPTAFQLFIQPNSEGTSAALLLLIQTLDSPGTAGPLPAYPLQSGSTAAVLVDVAVVYSGITGALIEALGNGNPAAVGGDVVMQTTLTPGGGCTITATGGAANLLYFRTIPVIGGAQTIGPVAVSVGPPASSFVVTISASGDLQLAWSTAGGLSCSGSGTPALDATTATITYDNALSAVNPYVLAYPYWGDGTSFAIAGANTLLVPGLGTLNANVFALSNLLFPQANVLQLSGMAFDTTNQVFNLTGSLTTPFTVDPVVSNVAPGGTVQFTASEKVIWSATTGKFNREGVYTAPQTAVPIAVTVTAMNESNDSVNALVNVVPATVAPSPAALVITPQTVLDDGNGLAALFYAQDQNGNAVAATWSASGSNSPYLSPVYGGTQCYFGQRLAGWPLPAGTNVTITATSQADPSQTATATFIAGTADPVTINGSKPAPGQTAEFTASAQSGRTPLLWSIWPADCGGSVVPNGEGLSAAVTAPPASFTGGWCVAVYYADPVNLTLGGDIWYSTSG